MKWFRKNLFLPTILVFSAFILVLVIESSHHHQDLESHDDCSICAWQATGSHAPNTPASPSFSMQFLILSLGFTLPLFYFSRFSPAVPGRSPPYILL